MKNSAFFLVLLLGLSANVAFGHSTNKDNFQKVFDLPKIKITITNLIEPKCNGENNGIVSVEASGGKAPYTYNWNTFPNQYESTAVGLKQGVYFVYVSDSEGNSGFKSIQISDPSHSILTGKEMKSLDELDLTTTVSSSDPHLNYSLNELSIESYKIAELPVGVHKLRVIDSKQCVLTQYIQVFELKSEGKNEIKATAEFINEAGGKILVSDLISGKKETNVSTGIILKKKE